MGVKVFPPVSVGSQALFWRAALAFLRRVATEALVSCI